jgi:hypothetical protein
MRYFFPLLFVILCPLLLTGCQPSRPISEGRLGLPRAGYVKIIVGKTVQTPTSQTAHWSIIGERNWTVIDLTGEKISLSTTSPLNSATQTPNANIWEMDLNATQTEAILSVRGINGTQKTSKFVLTSISDVSVLTQTDQELSLPASLPLVKIGDKTVLLAVAK